MLKYKIPQIVTLTQKFPLSPASCIDYIKGYDPIRKKPVKLYV